ncbi:aspartate carbamoyltransferase [Candidatus Bathyarchaeota archaeon]|nr:aspartate carbamoyltransferase [Candidatus Bathyarchaeota archaeon]
MVDASYFKGKDVISMRDYGRKEIDFILNKSTEMIELIGKRCNLCQEKILATLFFEPSTRTRLSFETAMLRLGGTVIGFSDPSASSVKKGETLEDTIKTVENYADIIAIRHPEEDAAKKAADVADIPILNGGSGPGEHPTQALLDLHTIIFAKRKINGLKIGLCGDLLYGRTTHSLALALNHFNVDLYLISPEELSMKKDIRNDLKMNVTETSELLEVLPKLDVLYNTRIQKERFTNPEKYESLKNSYIITPDLIKKGKKELILMHPLPRINEITPDVDKMVNAWYFKQVKHGVYVRMALILLALGL